jgi:hypothetical protein
LSNISIVAGGAININRTFFQKSKSYSFRYWTRLNCFDEIENVRILKFRTAWLEYQLYFISTLAGKVSRHENVVFWSIYLIWWKFVHILMLHSILHNVHEKKICVMNLLIKASFNTFFIIQYHDHSPYTYVELEPK